MSARCSSVAGNGNCVGIGGGISRLGQSQLMSCTLLESTVFVDIPSSLFVSPIVEKLSVIMPRAVHASLLRNSSELSVKYTTWRVSNISPALFVPEKRRIVAPRILMFLLLAACIFKVTGIILSSFNPKR